MSVRSRKFIYSYENADFYGPLQKMSCRYHIIANYGKELHGFIYLNEAKSVESIQKRMKNENVFITTDNNAEIVNELKSRDSFWENGSLPRCIRDKKMDDLTLCNIIAKQNDKLIDNILEEKSKLQEQNAELQKALLQKSMIVQNNTITNSNNDNSKNKKININVFLNTECKDAITLKDFINNLVVREEDLECMKQLGYVESVTKLLKRALTEYDLTARPIHCTDLKREVMHVKDQEGWKKESGETPNIDRAFRQITHIHQKKMTDVYRDVDMESKYFEDKANLMHKIAYAGGSHQETYRKKIIKNITDDIRL